MLKRYNWILIFFWVFLFALLSQFYFSIKGLVIPITGQTLGIIIAAFMAKRKTLVTSIVLYLILGAIGLPVFAEFSGGYHIFLSPSVGYLIGFLPMALLVQNLYLFTFSKMNVLLRGFLAGMIGQVFILILGAIGLLFFIPAELILSEGVLPFILPGIIKSVIAAILIFSFEKITPEFVQQG